MSTTISAKSHRTLAACLLFLGIVFMSQASVKADTITFESDALGLYPNGIISVESSLVLFRTSPGGGVVISENFGEFIGTRGLAVQGTPVHLIMDFVVPVTSLSLFFGNDDPFITSPGDTAILEVFLDGVLVGQTTVLMNRNDLADQQISFSATTFNSATFRFSQQFFLSETVDNVEFTPVPEPTSLVLLGIGIAGIAARICRRAKNNFR